MKSLKKYGIIIALMGAVTVQAQTSPPNAMSGAEMKVQADRLDKEIEADHRHVLHLQALARKEKDVIKLTCINDKLVQMKAQMNIFETSRMQLEAAAGATDDSPRAAFSDLEKAGTDIKNLRGEADQCAGELDMYKQESKSDVDRPELDDPTDTGGFDGNPETEVDVPGFATPYQ